MSDSFSENSNRFGLSGNVLKIIACLSMLTDHFGVMFLGQSEKFAGTYLVCRAIGRLTFPIFIFLLVEGFFHTSSRKKYLIRLIIFALISEIPFDLANTGELFNFDRMNTLVELTIGFVTMYLCEIICGREKLNFKLKFVLSFLVAIALGVGASLIHADYGIFGILMIFLLYLFYPNRNSQIFGGALGFALMGISDVISAFAALAFVPIYFYNGKRGKNLKYLFYLFYPVHLFILYVLKTIDVISIFS